MLTLVKNIKELVGVETSPKLRKQGKEMSQLETIKDAYLLIEDGIISKYGTMSEFDTPRPSATTLQEGMVENRSATRIRTWSMPTRASTSLSTRFAASATRKSPRGEEVSSTRPKLRRRLRRMSCTIWPSSVLKRRCGWVRVLSRSRAATV